MSQIQFNPQLYRGKSQVYLKVPGYQGICHIWEWNPEKQKYEKRNIGLRFCAYKKISGIQKTKFFDSFDDAKRWRESPFLFESIQPENQPLFKEVMQRFFAQKKNKWRVTTFETYESNSKHLAFFHDLPMNQVTPKAVDAWLQIIKRPEYLANQHHTRSTYKHELSLLRQICLYYSEYLDDCFQLPCKKRHLEDSILDPVKYEQMKSDNKFRFIPRADSEKFLAEMNRRGDENLHLKVLSVLALFQLRTGCRIGEVCAIRWEDIDLETGEMLVSKTVQWSRKKGRETCISPLTKTGEPRLIYAPEQVLGALKEWSLHCGRSKGLVFSHNGLTPIQYRSVQHHFNAAFKAMEMPWNSTHILRHSFATDFLERTQNQHALKEQLGHKSLKQTEHYSKVTKALTEAGIRAYEKTFGPGLSLVKKPSKVGGGLGEAG